MHINENFDNIDFFHNMYFFNVTEDVGHTLCVCGILVHTVNEGRHAIEDFRYTQSTGDFMYTQSTEDHQIHSINRGHLTHLVNRGPRNTHSPPRTFTYTQSTEDFLYIRSTEDFGIHTVH